MKNNLFSYRVHKAAELRKIAAELGDEYYPALERHSDVIAREVIENICDRHIKRLFDK